MSGGPPPEHQKQYKRGLHYFATLLPILAKLGYSLGKYKKMMADFAVKMDAPDSDQRSDGLAELFGQQCRSSGCTLLPPHIAPRFIFVKTSERS